MGRNHTFISFCFRSYCLSLAFEKTSDKSKRQISAIKIGDKKSLINFGDKRNNIQIRSQRIFSTFPSSLLHGNLQIRSKLPWTKIRNFSKPPQGDFSDFLFLTAWMPNRFLWFGYRFAVKNKGVSKGENPLGAGFPIGARSTLLAHTLQAKYSVLDLWRPLTLKRGVPWQDNRFTAAAEKRLSTSTSHAWWIASFRV